MLTTPTLWHQRTTKVGTELSFQPTVATQSAAWLEIHHPPKRLRVQVDDGEHAAQSTRSENTQQCGAQVVPVLGPGLAGRRQRDGINLSAEQLGLYIVFTRDFARL